MARTESLPRPQPLVGCCWASRLATGSTSPQWPTDTPGMAEIVRRQVASSLDVVNNRSRRSESRPTGDRHLQAAVAQVKPTDVFMTAASPGMIALFLPGACARTQLRRC
jgi:hypothetical protein